MGAQPATSAATGPGSTVQLLHPGMPKAASTWLQNVFFAGHPQLAVLGPEDRHEDLARRFVAAVERLVLGSDLQDTAAVVAELAALALERAAAAPAARVVGLSHEALAGAWPAPRNVGFVARTLGGAFPDAKVLIVVREQRAALVSGWREFVRMGGTLSFPRFLWDPAVGGDPVEHPLATAVLGTATYAPLVAAWRAATSPRRVKVLPMELLQRDPATFARALCAFLGVDEWQPPPQHANVQLSEPSLAVLRRLNHLFHDRRHVRYGPKPIARLLQLVAPPRGPEWERAAANPYYVRYRISDFAQRWLAKKVMPRLDALGLGALGGRVDRFARLPAEGRRWLEDRFAQDNAQLRAMIDWEPAEWGYLVGEGSGRPVGDAE